MVSPGPGANDELQLVIREATESDLPAVLDLYAQPDLDNGKVLSAEAARRVFGRFALYPDYHLHVAVIGDRVVGTFALLIMDNLAHMGTPSGVVEDVVVCGEFQSRGIGRRMMNFARERCAARGCYKMALSSNLKRERAHQFYEDIGFEKHGYSFRIHP
jgi:GNAT superfamily N-acetyltransferase